MGKNSITSSKKRGIIIGLIVGVVVVIIVIVVISPGSQKQTSTTQQQKQLEKIVNKVEAQKEDSQVVIARIESVIKDELSGNNNQGNAYLQWMLVDRRYTENEEYFATIRFNADIYPVTTNYQVEKKKEKESIEKKMAELLKALYGREEKITIIQIEAYDSTSTFSAQPVYSIELQKEQADTIDWSQNIDTLYTQVLPNKWLVKNTNYSLIN